MTKRDLRQPPPSDPGESPVSPDENAMFPLIGEQSVKRESEDEESAKKRSRGVEEGKEDHVKTKQEEDEESVGIEDEDEDAAGDEEREHKCAKEVSEPPFEEIERHRRTHIPFRVCCRWCVMGK